jgi:penicillin-binding protein 1A
MARKTTKPRRFLRFALKWTVVAGIWTSLAGAAVLTYFFFSLPSLDGINTFNRRPGLTFVAADGAVVATSGDVFAGPVALNELPPHLIQAVLATEDRRFYSHFGVDPLGVARALWIAATSGRFTQGASTITQQLAKIVFLTPERSLHRKIQEFLLALWLERRFSKDEILTLYLNRVYLGAGAFGVEAASRRYFGKRAAELNRHEAAVLAALLQAPSRLSPLANPEGARDRAELVIANMVEAGFLTASQAIEALSEDLRFASGSTLFVGTNGRYFVDWLAQEVQAYLGAIDRDLVVVTTLDLRLQRAAERAVDEGVARDGPAATASQSALVAMSGDGAVRAMVGGRDYRDSQFNRAADARRQPGSAFKPFVFLAAVESGLRPDDLLSDAPVTVGNWNPRNFDNTRRGEITAREALSRSVNTATVRAAQRAGLDRVIAAARRTGVTSPMQRNMATVLGASEVTLLELTAAYAPFGNGGEGVIPYGIIEIREVSGRVIYRRTGSGPGIVIEPAPLAAMADMMQAVIRSGTGRAAALDRPAAGKTGTSQEYRDAWFVGFTADLVAGVWSGNDDGAPMERVTGGSLPARIWRAFMVEAHRGLPARPLPGADAISALIQ